MKKIIAKEILIFLSTSAIFGLILILGWTFQPNEIDFKILPTDWTISSKTYSNTHEAYLAALSGESDLKSSEEFKARLKEYDNNKNVIQYHWYIITIIEIILICCVYPMRMLYYLIKWSLNNLQISNFSQLHKSK